MTAPAHELERQIEAAFDYRSHVTITLKDGKRVVGMSITASSLIQSCARHRSSKSF
jgi:hypothetical protein